MQQAGAACAPLAAGQHGGQPQRPREARPAHFEGGAVPLSCRRELIKENGFESWEGTGRSALREGEFDRGGLHSPRKAGGSGHRSSHASEALDGSVAGRDGWRGQALSCGGPVPVGQRLLHMWDSGRRLDRAPGRLVLAAPLSSLFSPQPLGCWV